MHITVAANRKVVEIVKAQLTREHLSTLMVKVTGIVNARSLTAIPTDVDM